jgi:hypothetical protein
MNNGVATVCIIEGKPENRNAIMAILFARIIQIATHEKESLLPKASQVSSPTTILPRFSA